MIEIISFRFFSRLTRNDGRTYHWSMQRKVTGDCTGFHADAGHL